MLIRRRLILVAAALVAVSCTPADLASEPASNRLLVTGGDGSVNIVEDDGTVVEELAGPGGGGSPVQATSAPDGSAVVWTSGAATRLWADGDVTTIEPDFVPFFYLWSPDGSQILALGNDPVQPSVRAALIGRDGSVEVVVIDRPIYAQWLDATQLVMHIGSRHVAFSDGGEPVIFGGGSSSYLAPDVLDGRVVMVGDVPGALTASMVEIPIQESGEAVVLMDLLSGETQTVVEFSNAVSFAVNPDQQRLAVLRGVRSSGFLVGDLAVVDIEDGTSIPMSEGPVVMYEWSSDGSNLLMMLADEDARLRPVVWDGESVVEYPSFRPTPTLMLEYLPFWDQYERSISMWSPDGSAFAYPGSEDGAGGIYVQRLHEDDPVRVADGVFVSWMQGG